MASEIQFDRSMIRPISSPLYNSWIKPVIDRINYAAAAVDIQFLVQHSRELGQQYQGAGIALIAYDNQLECAGQDLRPVSRPTYFIIINIAMEIIERIPAMDYEALIEN